MKRAVLGAIAVVMAISAYPAYADDLAVSLQGTIDDLAEVRNTYLAERAFGDSYLTPEIAAMETVRSAIELYESTKAHQVSVGDQEYFARHTNPYGPGEVAFDVINSMRSNAEVYPFVLDAATLKVVAEGAFPVTVGLSAVFLSDADRPLEEILEDLEKSDGTWVSYVYSDPNTNRYENKHAWLSLHDGYIFGAGYYELPDDGAMDSVSAMIRQYGADGEESFASISAVSGVSFVLDAETLEIVAHTDSDRSGSDIRDAIDINWPLESLSSILDNHEGLWLSYQSADPQPDGEYIRAYLKLHDGYVFGSGYGITLESRIQSLVAEAVQLYDLEGADALDLITAMKGGTEQAVLDPRGNTIVAWAGYPGIAGLNLGGNFFDQDQETILQYLRDHSGLWVDSLSVGAVGSDEIRRNMWVVLHDEYLFAASDFYSPEAVSIAAVDTAVELYKTHGEEAFDRINWQSIRPEIIYPFVVDAETWETIAHGTVPGRVGACCSQAIAESNDLDAAREALEESPGWLEYTFYNPISERNEYKRVWLTTYDGYTFGAGYYYGNFEQSQSVIDDLIDIYETEGKDAAFDSVNAMAASGIEYPFVMEYETLDIVAHGQNPNLVGTNLRDQEGEGGVGSFIPVAEIESDLYNDGDTTFSYYNTLDPETGTTPTKIVLFQLHDGYIFAVGQPFVVYTR